MTGKIIWLCKSFPPRLKSCTIRCPFYSLFPTFCEWQRVIRPCLQGHAIISKRIYHCTTKSKFNHIRCLLIMNKRRNQGIYIVILGQYTCNVINLIWSQQIIDLSIKSSRLLFNSIDCVVTKVSALSSRMAQMNQKHIKPQPKIKTKCTCIWR